MIIQFNFPSPELDYAILPLITTAFFTQIPLWALLLIRTIKKAIQKCNSRNNTTEDSETTDGSEIKESDKLNSDKTNFN